MADRLMLTVAEVAEALRMGRTRVYDLLRTGELPSVLIGSSRRVRVADLSAYVESLVVA